MLPPCRTTLGLSRISAPPVMIRGVTGVLRTVTVGVRGVVVGLGVLVADVGCCVLPVRVPVSLRRICSLPKACVYIPRASEMRIMIATSPNHNGFRPFLRLFPGGPAGAPRAGNAGMGAGVLTCKEPSGAPQ